MQKQIRESGGKFWIVSELRRRSVGPNDDLIAFVDDTRGDLINSQPLGPFDTREEAEFWASPQWTEAEIEAMKSKRIAMVDHPAYKAEQAARTSMARQLLETIAKDN